MCLQAQASQFTVKCYQFTVEWQAAKENKWLLKCKTLTNLGQDNERQIAISKPRFH